MESRCSTLIEGDGGEIGDVNWRLHELALFLRLFSSR